MTRLKSHKRTLLQAGVFRPAILLVLLLLICSGCDDLGTPPELEMACTVSPSVVDFGQVETGTSVDHTVRVDNTGEASISIDLSESCTLFEIIAASSSVSIAPGESFSFVVRFNPNAEAPANCSIDLGTDCPVVTCVGVGAAPQSGVQCELSTTSLDFGVVDVGQSVVREFVVRNTGTIAITGAVTSLQSEYEVTVGGGAFTLAVGDSSVVEVRFSPTTEGTVVGSISTGVDCGFVSLTGIGQAPSSLISFSQDIQPIFTTTCATNGCHGGASPSARLDLRAGTAWAKLVGIVSNNYAPAVRVVRNNPGASVLYNKISNTGVYGNAMPVGSSGLNQAQRQLFEQWILDGAPDN